MKLYKGTFRTFKNTVLAITYVFSITNDGQNRFCCFRCDYNICIQNWNPERLRFYHDNDEEKSEKASGTTGIHNQQMNVNEIEKPPSYEEVIRLKRKDTF